MIISLKQDTVDKVVAALPDPVRRMLKMSRLYLAGGFIRALVAGEKPSDIDIFGSSKEELERYAKLLANGKSYRATRNALTVALPGSPQVQFILRWVFPHISAVVESFDFTIAQAAIHYAGDERWLGVCSEFFFEDVEEKNLRYTSPVREEDAAGSLLRVRKFLGRGYQISDVDLSKVVARITKSILDEKAKNDNPPMYLTSGPFDVEVETWKVFDKARRVGGDSV